MLSEMFNPRENIRKFTDIDNGEHVKAGRETAREADQRVVKYLPSSAHS